MAEPTKNVAYVFHIALNGVEYYQFDNQENIFYVKRGKQELAYRADVDSNFYNVVKELARFIRGNFADDKEISKHERELLNMMACCGFARQRSCVCYFSTECPVHGSRCTGTHD